MGSDWSMANKGLSLVEKVIWTQSSDKNITGYKKNSYWQQVYIFIYLHLILNNHQTKSVKVKLHNDENGGFKLKCSLETFYMIIICYSSHALKGLNKILCMK